MRAGGPEKGETDREAGGDREAGADPERGEGRYEASLVRLRGELSAVVEALDDLALEILRDASEEGATSRPDLERRVTRARSGIERSLRLLGDAP